MSQAAANALYRFFAAVDKREWDAAKELMHAPFHLDYSSFGGGDAADLDPAVILEGWEAFLPGFDVTHHQLGNVDLEVDGDSAVAEFYGTATHLIDERAWVVVGTYRATLAADSGGWRLTGLRFRFKYQLGDTGLPEEALARIAG